jgi:exodeoxyribonuclease V alpha subunit
MVDAFLIYRLLRALPKGVRLVLVGDPAQLPPIGPGLVLHALAGSSAIPQTELTTTKRQSAASGIPRVATAIREHRTPVFADYEGLGSGVSFVRCKEHELDAEIVRIYEELGGSGDDYTVQILSPTKASAGGTRNLNIALHNRYRANAHPVYCYDIYGGHGTVDAATNERVLLRVGDLVLFTVNDYTLELRNGSLGRVIKAMPKDEVTSGDSDCCTIEWDDGRKLVLKAMHIPALTHAYGLTIHKSQGSQFERVIVPIRKNRILDQTLIYTAVTRGVKQVVLVGDEDAARSAILAPPSASRRYPALAG